MTLLAIAAGVMARDLAFELRRDREEELLHRGVAYERAIRLYASKTGRYPNRPEDLLGTADMRYLRKAYKDPITGKDFRMLHMSDVQPKANGTPADAPNDNLQTSSNTTGNGTQDQSSQSPDASISNGPGSTSANNAASADQPGLLIFGVASTSKLRTIREFNHQNHYNDWWFYSIPATNRGFEHLEPTPDPTMLQAQPSPHPNQSGSSQ